MEKLGFEYLIPVSRLLKILLSRVTPEDRSELTVTGCGGQCSGWQST